jgi:excisionase family DNA binding protein
VVTPAAFISHHNARSGRLFSKNKLTYLYNIDKLWYICLVKYTNMPITLSISSNILKKIDGFDGYTHLYLKDESSEEINETHTFKDRQPQALAKLLPVQYPGRHIVIAAMSTGNTAFSIAHFAREYNKKEGAQLARAVIFVPDTLEQRRYFGPDTSLRTVRTKDYMDTLEGMATVVRLNFQEKNSFGRSKYLESLTLAKECLSRGLIEDLFIDVTEGLETAAVLDRSEIEKFLEQDYVLKPKLGIRAYEPVISEAVEAMQKEHNATPDIIVTQFGAGILYNEIVQYCKDHAINAEVVPVAVGSPISAADKIYASFWVDHAEGMQFMGTSHSKHVKYPALVHGVEDWELGRALEMCRDRIDAEISGVAGLAILHRLGSILGRDVRNLNVLVINTGNGIPNFIDKKRSTFPFAKKDQSDLISLREASALLGVHLNTLRHWESKGIIHSIRLGSRQDRKFRREEVDRLLSGGKRDESKEYAFHKGLHEFKSLFVGIQNRLQKGDYYWAFAFDSEYADPKVRAILREVHADFSEKNVEDKIICRKGILPTIEKTFTGNANIAIKAVEADIPTGVIILRDRVIYLLWGSEPAAYELLNAEAVRQYQNLFVSLWNKKCS